MRLKKLFYCFAFYGIVPMAGAQTTNTYTTSTTWTVPAGVNSIGIKVYGGAAGTGGMDCGAGCTNTAASAVGYVLATYAVTPGNTIGIYPGGAGGNGGNSVTGSGGGAAGVATYNIAYNGGTGGNAGSAGSSGGGGGGGAASVVTINAVIKIVAGGAGGGGGMANSAGSGLPGNSSYSANGTSNAGGNGTMPGGDGGGGGAGGGGQFGSLGGGVHAAGAESAGNGGFMGGNSVTGASVVTTNGNISWTNTGQIEVTYTVTLAVTWFSFTATPQGNTVALHWSTATEQDTKDYTIQRSSNGVNWNSIGQLPAAGNSSTEQQYRFADPAPLAGNSYYRLLQRDINGKINYSDAVVYKYITVPHTLSIYPNPVVNGKARISISEAAVVSVYNSTGTRVLQQSLSAGEHTLNVSALAKGTYYIKCNSTAVLFYIQ